MAEYRSHEEQRMMESWWERVESRQRMAATTAATLDSLGVPNRFTEYATLIGMMSVARYSPLCQPANRCSDGGAGDRLERVRALFGRAVRS